MKFRFTITVILVFCLGGCGKWIKHANIFPISQDVNLGYQVSQNFDQENSKIILDSAKNIEVYKYLYGIRDSILNTQ